LECDVPTLGLHRSEESWNRYQPEDVWNAMCQHSHYTGIRNPGILTLRRIFGTLCAITRITWDKWSFCRELQTNGEESTRGREFQRELPVHLPRFRPVRSKCTENPSNANNSRISSFKSYILTMPTFKKFKYETSLKLKTNLIRPY
jgi:hypothetical protein